MCQSKDLRLRLCGFSVTVCVRFWQSTKCPDDPQNLQVTYDNFHLIVLTNYQQSLMMEQGDHSCSTRTCRQQLRGLQRYDKWKIIWSCTVEQYSTLSSCLPTAGLIFSSTMKITIPLSSIPLLPARPDIWMYSPEVIYSTCNPTRHQEERHVSEWFFYTCDLYKKFTTKKKGDFKYLNVQSTD